jgi:hypothetical protein
MLFSIITPSFKQLVWLRLCVASVRDQAAACGGIANSALLIADSDQQSAINNFHAPRGAHHPGRGRARHPEIRLRNWHRILLRGDLHFVAVPSKKLGVASEIRPDFDATCDQKSRNYLNRRM